MSVLEIVIIIFAVVLVVGVFAYSIKQNKDAKKPKMNFLLELLNHFGDGVNMKR